MAIYLPVVDKPRFLEKLGREVKVRNSHKRLLEQSTWVEVEVDMDRNEDYDVLDYYCIMLNYFRPKSKKRPGF